MKIHFATEADFIAAGTCPFIFRITGCGWLEGQAARNEIAASHQIGTLGLPELRRVAIEGAEESTIRDADAVVIACNVGEENSNGAMWKLNPLALHRLVEHFGIKPERLVVFDPHSQYEWDPSALYTHRDGFDLKWVADVVERMTFIRSFPAYDPMMKVRSVAWPIPVEDRGVLAPGSDDVSALDWHGGGLAKSARMGLYEWAHRAPTVKIDPMLSVIGDIKIAREFGTKFDPKESLARVDELVKKQERSSSISARHVGLLCTAPPEVVEKFILGIKEPHESARVRNNEALLNVPVKDYPAGDAMRLAAAADAKMVLCTREQTNCLPRTVYEAMSLGRVPLIVGCEKAPLPVTVNASDWDFSLRIHSSDARDAGKLVATYMSQQGAQILEKCARARQVWETCCSPASFARNLAATIKSRIL